MKSIATPFFILIILFSTSIFGQVVQNVNEEFKIKKIHRTFNVDNITSISINNEFGDINIRTKDNIDSIECKVIVFIDTDNEQQASRIRREIFVHFTRLSGRLKITTKFLKGLSHNHKYKITYNVTIPENINLNINNKFGNVTINKITGKIDINLNYGILKIDEVASLHANNNIHAKFVKVEIGELTKANINLNYSKLEIKNAENIKLKSQYSSINIDNISELTYNTEFDKCAIDSIKSAEIIGGSSNIVINKIIKYITMKLNHGKCNINYVARNFDFILLDNENVDTNIKIDDKNSYAINAKVEYASLKYPKSLNVQEAKDDNIIYLQGTIGEDNSSESTVTLISSYGNIIIE